MQSFCCIHCGAQVAIQAIGTQHRNHCPLCLWSVHLDRTPGDRRAECGGAMQSVALAFKNRELNERTGRTTGELMVVHQCTKCGALSANRIAGDDEPQNIMKIFEKSLKLAPELVQRIKAEGIDVLSGDDADEMKIALFGYD